MYAFDFDHTLIYPNEVSSTPGLDILKKFLDGERKDGALLTVITGRSKNDLITSLNEAKIALPDFIITDLGSKIYALSKRYQKTLLNLGNVQWSREKIDAVIRNHICVRPRKKSRSSEYKLSYYIEPNESVIMELRQILKQRNLDSELLVAKAKYLYVTPRNVNKATALRYLLKKLKLTTTEIFVGGDDYMDLPMIKLAGAGVLVASEEALNINRTKIYISRLPSARGILDGIKHMTLRAGDSARQKFHILIKNGLMYEDQGRFLNAAQSYSKALSLAKSYDHALSIINASYRLGRIKTTLGHLKEGRLLMHNAHILYESRGFLDSELLARILNSMSFNYRLDGKIKISEKLIQRALKIKGLHISTRASIYHNRGGLNRDINNFRGALRDYRLALRLNRNDAPLKIKTINNIGFIYRKLGKLHSAISHYNRALIMERKLGLSSLTARTLNNIGGIYRLNNRPEVALGHFMKSAKIRELIGDKMGVSSSYLNIGRALIDMNRTDEAKKYMIKSLRIRTRLGSRMARREVSKELGQLKHSYGF